MIPNWHSYRISRNPDWAPKRLVWDNETPGGNKGEGGKKETKEGKKPAEAANTASSTPAKKPAEGVKQSSEKDKGTKETKETKEKTPVQQLKEELGKLDGDIASKLQQAEALLDKVEASPADEKVKTQLRSTINSKLSEIQKGNKNIDDSVRFNINRLQLKMAQKEKTKIGKLKYLFNSLATLLPALKDFMTFDPEKMQKAADKLGDYGNMVVAAIKGKGEIGPAKKIDKNAGKLEEKDLPPLSIDLSKGISGLASKVSSGNNGYLNYKKLEEATFSVKWNGEKVMNQKTDITDKQKEDPLVQYLKFHAPHAERIFTKIGADNDAKKAQVMNAFVQLQSQENDTNKTDPKDLLVLTMKHWDKYAALDNNSSLTPDQLFKKITKTKGNSEMKIIKGFENQKKSPEKKASQKEAPTTKENPEPTATDSKTGQVGTKEAVK